MKKIILALSGLLLSFGAMAQPAPSSFPGCVYNSTPPSLSDKQTTALQCDSSGRVKTTGAGTITFPATVAGTVTSGGIPYFNSTTQMSSSAILGSTQVVLGGGAGAAPSSSSSLTYASGKLTVAGGANTSVFASTGYSLTGTDESSMVDLAGTWNTSGTPTGIKLNITDTASNAASLLLNLQVGGVSAVSVAKSAAGAGWVLQGSAGTSRFTSTANIAQIEGVTSVAFVPGLVFFGSAYDTALTRDAANVLAQRNGTNAQTFKVYGTYTDASNYERGSIQYQSGGSFVIAQEKAGTGSFRPISFSTSGVIPWQIAVAGHLIAPTDNTYDIGASGATRPRNTYVAGFVSAQSGYGLGGNGGASQGMSFSGTTTRINSGAASGGIDIRDQSGLLVSFAAGPLVQFGGTTSSFPALKRSTTTLEAKLADDSAYTQVAARGVIVAGAVPTLALAGGTCAGTVITGGSTAGLVTLTGVCAATNTMTLSAMPTAPTGYICDAVDRTTGLVSLAQTSTSTTTAVFTFSATTGATDVIAYKCMAY